MRLSNVKSEWGCREFYTAAFRGNDNGLRVEALVSSRFIEPLDRFSGATHVICDLDKTYLETEFESWIKMAKIPFESPHDKITVPGASEVLELARWGGDPRDFATPRAGIHFVSSSPPQLRLALDGKLTMDHLEWSSDTFKNQGYNLRMARIDLLRHHIAYKTKAILDIVTRLPPGSQVVLIGDNAEYDAFIYTGVRLFLDRRVNVSGLKDWLRGARVEESVIAQVVSGDISVSGDTRVAGVYIRSVAGYPGSCVSRLDGTWKKFDHWAQVAWSLMKLGIINASALPRMIRSFHNLHGIPLAHLRWCVYKALADETLTPSIKSSAEATLAALGSIGASGPSRRMLSWEFEMESEKSLDDIGDIDPRVDASQWYQSVEAARSERKRRRR